MYYNYVFNKTRLKPDITIDEWKEELEVLKEHLDMGKPQDYIAYHNVELELLRQTGAERSELDANVQDTLTYIRNSDMPDKNRCMLEASVARIESFLYLVSIRWKMVSPDLSVRKAYRKDWGFRWYRQVPLVLETLQRESRKKSKKYAISLKDIYRKLVEL